MTHARPRPAGAAWSRLRSTIASALRGSRSVRVGAGAMLVALVCWALASPVGASPDEDFHINSLWCSHGFEAGICEEGSSADSRRVPAELVQSTCYAFHSQDSAACQQERPLGEGMIDTKRGNFDGVYPPVFYWTVGLFVSDNVDGSVVAMRIFNALLYVGLIAALYALVAPGLRRPLVGAALLTAVPLGVFIIPSINPSSWAMLSATTLLVSVLGYLRADSLRRRIGLGALAGLSLLIGAGARADAAMYAVVAIGVALILTVRWTKEYALRAAYPAVLALVALPLFLMARQSEVLDANASPVPFTLGRLVRTMADIPSLWVGGLGYWGLGWLDTAMPHIVWVGSWSALVGVLFLAVTGLNWRGALAAALVAFAVVMVPTYVQLATGTKVGAMVQPRYVLPLVLLLAATLLIRLEGSAFRLEPVHRWIVVVLLTLGNAIALHVNIARYVTGTDLDSFNLSAGLEWWWSFPIGPTVVWALGSLTFALAAVLLTREFVEESPASPLAPATAGQAAPAVARPRSPEPAV